MSNVTQYQIDKCKATYKTTKKCNHLMPGKVGVNGELKKCRSIAIKDFSFCCHHIKKHPDEFESFLRSQALQMNAQQTAVVPTSKNKETKYSFVKKEFKDSFKEFYAHDNLTDLKNEIALLSATLNKLYAMNLNNTDNLKVIDTQIKVINQIRLLIKTMKDIDVTQANQISFNDLKIFMLNVAQVINVNVSDTRLKEAIGKKVFELYHQSNIANDALGSEVLRDNLSPVKGSGQFESGTVSESSGMVSESGSLR